jgi:hypothetical protein
MEGSIEEVEPSIFFVYGIIPPSWRSGTSRPIAIDAEISILFVDNNTDVRDL